MPPLIWAPSTPQDVQLIFYRFLVEKNIDAAKRAAKAIREGVKVLAIHPENWRLNIACSLPTKPVDKVANCKYDFIILFSREAKHAYRKSGTDHHYPAA